MSSPGEEFSRFALAERELCEQAESVLATIIERIQINRGVRITEVHVTIRDSNGSLKATCTIADAEAKGDGKGDGHFLK